MYKIKNDFTKNDAVSEILLSVIMLVIAVSVFTVLNLYILSDTTESSSIPSVSIVGQLEGNKIIIEHGYGPSLGLDTSCTVDIGGKTTNFTAEDLLNPDSRENGLWDIGERLVYEPDDITYLYVSVQVVDKKSNSLLFDGILQDGVISDYAFVILTYSPTNITNNSANLWLGYNFREKSGKIRFSYKQYGGSWINTSWISKSGSGIYNETISGLSPDKIYIYKAELNVESNISQGEEKPILLYGLTSVNKIIPSNITTSPLTIAANGSSVLDEINLFYRYSDDNVSWEKNWWHISWEYRKLITIDSSKVTTDLTNFPVLIYFNSDADLATYAQDDGDDIVFVLYDNNSTKLNHEIQFYNGSTGKLIAWVKIPSLKSSIDTKIWIYYRNPTANNLENPPGVWDSNFISVWHLDESPNDDTIGHYDSTSHNNNGIPRNFQDVGGGTTNAIGKIGGADYFAGDDDWIEVPHSSSLVINGDQLSLSAWVKPIDLDGNDHGIIVKSDGTNNNMYLGITANDKGNLRIYSEGGTKSVKGGTDLQVNQWYYLCGYYNGAKARVYLNGFEDGSGNRNGNIISPISSLIIGRKALGYNEYLNGIIDEVRISYSPRTPEWFETEYYNQNSPSTFYNVGSQEKYSGDWMEWNNITNPDTAFPWSWDFNFPHGIGYYEFYSIGTYDSYEEPAPSSADAICYYDPS